MRAEPIEMTAEKKDPLERMVGSSTAKQRLVFRARLILLSPIGLAGNAVGRQLGCRTAMVSKWRQRFLRQRLEGVIDAPRSGNPGFYGAETERRTLAMPEEPVPEGYARWNWPLLAKARGGNTEQEEALNRRINRGE